MKNRKITVIGSINMDLVTSTNRVPILGETLMGESFHTIPGGKGANQAVAAARLGADVTMIGCVGQDLFGQDLLKHLKEQGVNVDNVEPVTDTSTGIAAITISNGENQIIVIPGANYHVTPALVASFEDVIAKSDILLLQLEIPLESVEKAVELAHKHRVKVVLNPAPIQPLSKELLEKVDYLTPNEYEQQLLFDSVKWTEQERRAMLKKCIITRGSKGITFFQEEKVEIPSFKVDVVDTTGAGDSFNGGFAYSISQGASLAEACQFATAVAALSVTKLGAQGGMPTMEEVRTFLRERKEEL
ncbi:ribokinase [Bacillus sp. ISL-40]|uniref:ribokinase n=1 Tax=unclassified Bacillus (in: firmicutes) TaxID=185979 RepID=UPI001BECB31A|nr:MULTISPECIES: ribokinase [unclassified Bacillus (in: firmicutes)]MBT2695960.1 ribokinase [Bacillus sp. ISL-40]MBT2739684.1 ribokinase [Bacillus sp. ISL-77]